MTVICVFGDSDTYGALDREQGGWVNRLRKYIDSKDDGDMVYNLGISGDTSKEIMKRFKIECGARFREAAGYKENFAIIFSVGGNDASTRKKRTVTNREFSSNINKLIELAKEYTKNIFFLDLLPVSEPKVTPVPWNSEIFYRNKDINALNDILASICWQENVPIIKIRTEFEKANYHKLLADGLHPNEEGHELIFRIVKVALIKHKIIK